MRVIMLPAMIMTLLCGFVLAGMLPNIMTSGWFHAKVFLVAVLAAYHMGAARIRRQLADGTCKLDARRARVYNEIPTVLLILIVILVVVKPF